MGIVNIEFTKSHSAISFILWMCDYLLFLNNSNVSFKFCSRPSQTFLHKSFNHITLRSPFDEDEDRTISNLEEKNLRKWKLWFLPEKSLSFMQMCIFLETIRIDHSVLLDIAVSNAEHQFWKMPTWCFAKKMYSILKQYLRSRACILEYVGDPSEPTT